MRSHFATAFYVAAAMRGKSLGPREVDLLRDHYRRALGTAARHQEWLAREAERLKDPSQPRFRAIPFSKIGEDDEGE
jgi:hypothetical protein